MFQSVGIIFAGSGDGTGTKITSTLSSSYTDSVVFAIAGVGAAKLRLVAGKGGADSFDVQALDVGDTAIPGATGAPIQSEAESTGLRRVVQNYTASGEDDLFLDLGGSVEKLKVQVRANGAGPLTSSDFFYVELYLGGSVTAIE